MNDFRVWAPYAAEDVRLVLPDREVAMRPDGAGWWAAISPIDATEPVDYGFRIDGSAQAYPDPRSRWQPHGVHGLSRTVDPSRFAWSDASWHGRRLAGSVLYELHIGTFTAAGTFDAAIERIPYLVDLGVDAVELLPVAAVPGSRNWGYDGVALYAVTEAYGGPAGLVRFVDACHRAGLAVVLDVVHNHLGPSGNYLPRFGPYFGADQNAWGQALNLDGPDSDEVRRFVLDNALMWLRDYHLDGLRLDAVHALVDSRAIHILEQMAIEVDAFAASVGRELWLIAESDLNDPKLVRERAAHGYGLSAQWSDDIHHALHATLTGERQAYYVDFGSLATLAKALTAAFVHDGTWSTFRRRSHGRPADDIPASRFIAFLQDHDQIGNRAQGDRISATLSPGLLKVGAALMLCSPYTPMLFMGEEWGATTPWLFFCDPDSPELAEATRNGRRAEFADHGWIADEVPDPVAIETFERSKLDWRQCESDGHADILRWYTTLLHVRRSSHELRDPHAHAKFDEAARWFVLERGTVCVVANLGDIRQSIPVNGTPTSVLAASERECAYSDGLVSLDGESVAIVQLLLPT